MICSEAAESVSALCDGEIVPPEDAKHIGTCDICKARLRDYLAQGAELRRIASLEPLVAVPPRVWQRSGDGPFTNWWRKGWETMRIPRLAFAALIVGVVGLASVLAVGKVRARATGTVVLLNTTGPDGPLWDCPLSTLEKNQSCSWFGDVGSHHLAYKVNLLAREGDGVRLVIRTRTYSKGQNLSALTQDDDPAAKTREVWFEPGESLKLDVADVGTLTLKGEWMDHSPILGELDPGPRELRFGSPLLLKDGTIVGDFSSVIGGMYSQDTQDRAAGFYLPKEGRFLISQLPMKDAVEAHVALGRISFNEGGHSWELVNGVPVCRADHLWVLHQPSYKPAAGDLGDHLSFGNPKLVQAEPGVWVIETPRS
jgi:hypothetical protein